MVAASKATGAIDWGHIGMIAGKAVGIWLTATILGLLASRKISFLLKLFGERSAIALMALGLAFILAALFEEAGLAMIIGAYVLGLSLSKTDISNVVKARLHPIYEFLTPVFFCVMGMLIDLKAMGSAPVLLFGALYTLAAIAGKVLGGGVPPLLLNFNVRGAARIGLGMVPRGEVALIIAGIGLASGALTAEVFAAAIVMTAATTMVAPPMLVLSFRSGRSGVRRPVAARDGQATSVRFDFPSIETADFLIQKLSKVFDSEGFFVHRLSHDRGLYQMRKDTTIIDLHCTGTTLVFDCQRKDVPLINTAVMEAVAALEQAIRGLSLPLDTQAILARIQRPQEDARPPVSLQQYLRADLIEPNLKTSTKGEVIDELVGVLWRGGLVRDRRQVREAVWQREQSMPTGLRYGVAIPHGRTDAVDRLVCAVGIHKEGVDFQAMDDQPSKLFILTVSPERKAAPHMQLMATISQLLTAPVRERLLASSTSQEAYRALTVVPTEEEAAATPAPKPVSVDSSRSVLRRYLSADLVEPHLVGRTKEAILREMLDMLSRRGLVEDPPSA